MNGLKCVGEIAKQLNPFAISLIHPWRTISFNFLAISLIPLCSEIAFQYKFVCNSILTGIGEIAKQLNILFILWQFRWKPDKCIREIAIKAPYLLKSKVSGKFHLTFYFQYQ